MGMVAAAVLVFVVFPRGPSGQPSGGTDGSLFGVHPTIHYSPVVAGNKSAPPQPVDSSGVPALLSKGSVRDGYLDQMASRLDVSTTPPSSRVGIFARVLSASSQSLVVTEEMPSVSAPGAVRSVMTPAFGTSAQPLHISLTPKTILFLDVPPAELSAGKEIFVGGDRLGQGLRAILISDLNHMKGASGSASPASPRASPPPSNPSAPGAVASGTGQPRQSEVAAFGAAPGAQSVSTQPIVASNPSSLNLDVGGDNTAASDTVVLSGQVGGGIDENFQATVGDTSSCYVTAQAEFLAQADYEVHWPFQFHGDGAGAGFTVEALDRTPEAGRGFNLNTPFTSHFDQYSVYSGWGVVLGVGLQFGCHYSIGPVAGDVSFGTGKVGVNFAWINQTKRHIPLSGAPDLVVPPSSCPVVGINEGPVGLGIGVCQWQTYGGGLLRATLTGQGGRPQGIAMPYAGHDEVHYATAPAGGPVKIDSFNYAANITTKMVAGIVATLDLSKVKKSAGGKPGKEDSEPENVTGAYRSAQRHEYQTGPTTPKGQYKDGRDGQWHDADGKKSSSPPTEADISAGNANWEHPGQIGATLWDGRWNYKNQGWRNADGTIARKPDPLKVRSLENPATREGDKEKEPEPINGDAAENLNGWEYQNNSGTITPTDADPGSLSVSLPRPSKPPAPPVPSGPAAPVAYSAIVNPRYGFVCDVPANFLVQQAPANGDGFSYQSPDGQAQILCFGSNNEPLIGNTSIGSTSARQAYQQELASHSSHGDSVTYQALVGNSITVSGIRGDNGQIYFDRILWGSGSIDTLSWTYARSLQSQLKALVEHSAGTFRPGDLASGH